MNFYEDSHIAISSLISHLKQKHTPGNHTSRKGIDRLCRAVFPKFNFTARSVPQNFVSVPCDQKGEQKKKMMEKVKLIRKK